MSTYSVFSDSLQEEQLSEWRSGRRGACPDWRDLPWSLAEGSDPSPPQTQSLHSVARSEWEEGQPPAALYCSAENRPKHLYFFNFRGKCWHSLLCHVIVFYNQYVLSIDAFANNTTSVCLMSLCWLSMIMMYITCRFVNYDYSWSYEKLNISVDYIFQTFPCMSRLQYAFHVCQLG